MIPKNRTIEGQIKTFVRGDGWSKMTQKISDIICVCFLCDMWLFDFEIAQKMHKFVQIKSHHLDFESMHQNAKLKRSKRKQSCYQLKHDYTHTVCFISL